MNITDLEPKSVWANFHQINQIPRASKKEEKIIDFIYNFGNKLGLETIKDDTGNILIKKPASPGMENRQKIILQSHLDMVCQKNSDTQFDFDTQGIQTEIDGDWVRAKGTTLGADNGMGVASIMAILEDTNLVHPDIEALFTIDEETGMTGAFGLKPGFLSGNILLNLDTEEDNSLTIGCAGGIDVTLNKEYTQEPITGQGFELNVSGLQGGHSGADIHKDHGNANKILARLLSLGEVYNIQLQLIDGGGLRNAIPREAKSLFMVADSSSFEKAVQKLSSEIKQEFSKIEKDMNIELRATDISGQGLSHNDSIQLILLINTLHNGVYRMSPDIDGLVEASNNVARILLQNGNLEIMNLTRSSVESTKRQVAEQLASAGKLAGTTVTMDGGYPGWQPKPDAQILQVMTSIYQKLFQDSPQIDAIHAGLECGIIGAHYPEMEMISFGPTILGAHSPEERVSISSVNKFWKYLTAVLAAIPENKGVII